MIGDFFLLLFIMNFDQNFPKSGFFRDIFNHGYFQKVKELKPNLNIFEWKEKKNTHTHISTLTRDNKCTKITK